ncbi:hypothetical protein FZ043_15870 [Escherichia coli]|nr:hypothetical protein FZ043_15870 [Escherichia coli]
MMIRTGITYRFKQRVTEAGAIRLFCRYSWWGGGCPRGGSARKKAHFCDFIVIIIMSVIYCF